MKMWDGVKGVTAAVLALGLLAPELRAGDLATAKALFEQSRTEKDPQKQVKLLRDSIAQADTYEARFALGQALEGMKSYADSRKEFQKALELAANDKAKAKATAMVAETYLAENKLQEGLALLRASMQYHPYPNVEARLKEIELKTIDKPMAAAEIASALGSGATRAFGVKPAVSLRIGFDFDKATLTPAGKTQAEELGKALAQSKGTQYQIIGHTDTQGDDAYNDKLSLKRAEMVKDFLVKNHGLSAGNLTVVGKGEREPLYRGTTEQDHTLNRRVEVVAQQ